MCMRPIGSPAASAALAGPWVRLGGPIRMLFRLKLWFLAEMIRIDRQHFIDAAEEWQ